MRWRGWSDPCAIAEKPSPRWDWITYLEPRAAETLQNHQAPTSHQDSLLLTSPSRVGTCFTFRATRRLRRRGSQRYALSNEPASIPSSALVAHHLFLSALLNLARWSRTRVAKHSRHGFLCCGL